MSTCDLCVECDDPHDDDVETVAGGSGCRRRSRLSGAPIEQRSVTFDLPAAAATERNDDVDHAAATNAEQPTVQSGFVCARDSIFVVPGVTCLGCLLGHGTLKPVVDALRRNAASLSEPALLASAHSAYEDLRVKCRAVGLLAPAWSTQGIRDHFWNHAFDPVLEGVRLLRRFDEIQRVLLEEVERSSGSGSIPPQTLHLLQRVGGEQVKQHARLQKLLAACESQGQPNGNPTSYIHAKRRGAYGAKRRNVRPWAPTNLAGVSPASPPMPAAQTPPAPPAPPASSACFFSDLEGMSRCDAVRVQTCSGRAQQND